jgi:hypothetical protein
MNPKGEHILRGLQTVAHERALRAADPALGAAVVAVKAFQHQRFEATYADMLAHPRFGPRRASSWTTCTGRWTSRARRPVRAHRARPGAAVPGRHREHRGALADLHALSETLDSQMARALGPPSPAQALWPGLAHRGPAPATRAQIALMMAVGTALDRYTRNPLLRHSLRLMRGPAQAAGLGVLQAFPGVGLRHLPRNARCREFLDTVATARTCAGGAPVCRWRCPRGDAATPTTGPR